MGKEQVETTANPEKSGTPPTSKPPKNGGRKGKGKNPHRRSNGRNGSNNPGRNGRTR